MRREGPAFARVALIRTFVSTTILGGSLCTIFVNSRHSIRHNFIFCYPWIGFFDCAQRLIKSPVDFFNIVLQNRLS